METSLTSLTPNERLSSLPVKAHKLRMGLFAPPLVEPFQPSLSLPYLAAQMRSLGYRPTCHNLSSLFLVWLFRRTRLESMPQYQALWQAIDVLKSPVRFFEPAAYEESLASLEQFLAELGQRDHLAYTLFPESTASTLVDAAEILRVVDQMEETLLERFLQDYMGFTLRLEVYDVIAFSAGNALQLAASLFIARLLKRARVRATLLLGGHAATLAAEALLQTPALGDGIDAIILRGGAQAFHAACQDLVHGKMRRSYSVGDGVEETDGKGFPVDRPYRLVLQHDIQDFYLSPYQVFSVYSALGCSYGACTFCSSNRASTPYVPRRIAVLAEEMQILNALRDFTVQHLRQQL